jgi:hypothetical protein
VRDQLSGKRVKCPDCGKILLVPSQEKPANPEASSLLTPALRPRRLSIGAKLGLAGLGVLLVLAAGYWWLWVPSAAEEALFKDYLRSGNELVGMHSGLRDRAAAEVARPRLREKAQENMDVWKKMQSLPTRRRESLEKKYQAELAQLTRRLADLVNSYMSVHKPPLVVVWGIGTFPGSFSLGYDLSHSSQKTDAGPPSIFELAGTFAAGTSPVGGRDPSPPEAGRPAATAAASTPPVGNRDQLPGAAGPLWEYVGKAGPKVIGANVAVLDPKADNPPNNRRRPSGTKNLEIEVRFATKPQGKLLAIDVYGRNGKVEIGSGSVVEEANRATGEYALYMVCKPKAGKYEDGAYQARAQLDGEVVALVNWEIGGP